MLDPHVREEEVRKTLCCSSWLIPDSFPEKVKVGIRELNDVVDVHDRPHSKEKEKRRRAPLLQRAGSSE
jgi:hypothetical protein